MNYEERISVLSELGSYLADRDERLLAHEHRASVHNPWFTPEFIERAVAEIALLLQEEKLRNWTADIIKEPKPKRVGVVMAGNIPAVGFHDLLCVFISGHITEMKLSEKDKYLVPFFVKKLCEINPECEQYFNAIEKFQDIDAVIATGSNNSARYFEYYFSKYPNVIRRNRNAVAILTGEETGTELEGLCDDIFLYFGMGCRSVSHCFVPEDYNFEPLRKAAEKYEYLAQHSKYKNNLEYNLALLILNRTPYIEFPHLVIVNNPQMISPVSTLYYTTYADTKVLAGELREKADEIQCVVSTESIEGLRCVQPGMAQSPKLNEYADGVDTLAFLKSISQ